MAVNKFLKKAFEEITPSLYDKRELLTDEELEKVNNMTVDVSRILKNEFQNDAEYLQSDDNSIIDESKENNPETIDCFDTHEYKNARNILKNIVNRTDISAVPREVEIDIFNSRKEKNTKNSKMSKSKNRKHSISSIDESINIAVTKLNNSERIRFNRVTPPTQNKNKKKK